MNDGWKQMVIEQDPEWLEFHKEIDNSDYGKGILKMWLAGYWTGSFTEEGGTRHRFANFGRSEKRAKERLLELIGATP